MESFVRSLSDNPNRPCFFLQYGETFIMLDCALDVHSILKFIPVSQVFTPAFAQIKRWDHGNSFLYSTDNDILENEGHLLINGSPEFQVPDFQHVDPADLHLILISNFSQMFALPYLLDGRQFNGKIYATEPTIQLAKDVLQDMTGYLESYSGLLKADKWKSKEVLQLLPPALKSCKPHLLRTLYSMEALERVLKKVEVVNFRQRIELENSLVITAYSSGFCMGSCNWVLESPNEKICYLADSSTLTTHVLPIDLQELKDADVMIVSALNMDPIRSPEESLKNLHETIRISIRDGGNVLIPFSGADLLIDMLEYLYMYMTDDLPTSVPIIVLAGTARSMLSLSQVFSEWLNKEYRDRAYLPEEPFSHGEMLRNSRLKIFPSVDGKFSDTFKSPSIVFCSHYSLRFGPAVHLLSQWKSSPKNSLIFTDPEFHPGEALAPYLPVQLKVAYCPLDTRLKPSQLTKILETTMPKTVVFHERYSSSWDDSLEAADHVVRCPAGVTPMLYSKTTDVQLPVEFSWLETQASTTFLSKIPMSEFLAQPSKNEQDSANRSVISTTDAPKPPLQKILVGRTFGSLRTLDNRYIVEPVRPPRKCEASAVALSKPIHFERPDGRRMVRILRKEGFTDAMLVESDSTNMTIVAKSVGLNIILTKTDTVISSVNGSTESRQKLRRVMEMLRKPEKSPVFGVEVEDPNSINVLPTEGMMEVDSAVVVKTEA